MKAPPTATLTLALPLDALAVTVQAPPPALVSKHNASHVGMTGDELVRVLRAMRADPRFREEVTVHGKSFRAAPPDKIVAFLRAGAPATTANAVDAADEDAMAQELGYERRAR